MPARIQERVSELALSSDNLLNRSELIASADRMLKVEENKLQRHIK
jgi:hypothetical protein